MTIMIVDDLSPIALTYKSILMRAGYEAEVFTRSIEAITELQNNPSNYSLVISDIYMNEVNGVAVIATAKQMNPTIKTVCITGGGGFDQDTSLITEAREIADQLVFKPIHSGQLVNIVRTVLGEPEADRQATATSVA